jgi:hypothetical protein
MLAARGGQTLPRSNPAEKDRLLSTPQRRSRKEKGPEEEEVPRAFALEATNIQLGVFNTLSGGTHPVCEVLHALEEAPKEWKTPAAAY